MRAKFVNEYDSSHNIVYVGILSKNKDLIKKLLSLLKNLYKTVKINQAPNNWIDILIYDNKANVDYISKTLSDILEIPIHKENDGEITIENEEINVTVTYI